jgi:hypothetical protein
LQADRTRIAPAKKKDSFFIVSYINEFGHTSNPAKFLRRHAF